MKKIQVLLVILFLPVWVRGQSETLRIQKEYDRLLQSTSYGRNPKAGAYYDIRGFRMYCEVYGSGEPLLLIHGNGGSINNFVKQIPYFFKKYRVIIADSRSQGKSKDQGDSLTYEMMADDYAVLLTNMGIDSAHVIGWSDGAINGMLLAIRHPEKVKKLIITGANLQPDTTAISPDIHQRVSKTYHMLQAKTEKNKLDKKVYKFFRLLVEQPHIPESQLHRIKIPTLVIGGDQDVIRPGHTLTIFQNIAQANLWILPNSGHSTPVVYSDEFNRKADAFLRTPYRRISDKARYF